jgi:hypothetical protein
LAKREFIKNSTSAWSGDEELSLFAGKDDLSRIGAAGGCSSARSTSS